MKAPFNRAPGAPIESGDFEEALRAAEALLTSGHHAEAEQIFRRASERDPARVEPQLGLARVHLEAGRASDAIGILSRVLLTHPRSAEAHLLAASAYEELGRHADAADHIALVHQQDPEQPEINRRLATVLGRLGDTRGLIRCLRRVVASTRGEDLEARTMLGIALSDKGHHDEAMQILRDVAERRGAVSSAYADLGMASLGAGKLEAAVAALGQALELDPRSAQAHCGLGLCYQKMGRWKEAAQAFASTEEWAPQLAVGPLNLGLVLDALGDRVGARRALLRAAALEPGDQEICAALDRLFVDSPEGQLRGELRATELLDLLDLLRLRARTGTLTVRRVGADGLGTGRLRVVRGQITSASAPGTARFDQALVDLGLMARQALESIIARVGGIDRESPEELGTMLLGEQAVDRRQLSKLLSRRIHESLMEILSWSHGAFSFAPEEDREPPAIFFNLQDVMSELVRVSDKLQHGNQRPAH